jgi:nucleoside phosphorylase
MRLVLTSCTRFDFCGLVLTFVWQRRPGGKCKLIVGPLATGGQLINDATLLNKLVGSPHFKDCVGGEMEGWGVYEGAKLSKFSEWIVVKGVSDFASKKSYYYQPLAAAAAVDAVFSVLASHGSIQALQVGECAADIVSSRHTQS